MPSLIHLISAVTWGGGERYALDVCRHFRSRGWHVVAFTRDSRAVDAPFESEGVRLRHLPLRGYADWISPMRLASMLRTGRKEPTIIHVHKYKDAFTALLARKLSRRKDVKVILTRHLVKPAGRSFVSRCIYRNLDAQIFVSALARERFLSAWQGGSPPFPLSRLHTLHNSLLIEQPPYAPPPAKGPRIVLFLGRLSPEKGVETLIEALPALRGRRARARICGTGQADYVDSLKRLAANLGVMDLIDWKGYVTRTDTVISSCHVAVLPSVAEESFGLANIEIMAGGRVQICTASGAQPEYLTDGRNALFISPRDSKALSDKLISLLDDDAETPSVITMGRQAYEDYASALAWPRFASRLERIYAGEDAGGKTI